MLQVHTTGGNNKNQGLSSYDDNSMSVHGTLEMNVLFIRRLNIFLC